MALSYLRRPLDSRARELLFERSRVSGGFPVCRHCARNVMHMDRWDPDIDPDDPSCTPLGVAHVDCLRLAKTNPAAVITRRTRRETRARQFHIGALRSDFPMEGGRDHHLSKKMNGQVVIREFRKARAVFRGWPDDLDTQLTAVAAEMERPQ